MFASWLFLKIEILVNRLFVCLLDLRFGHFGHIHFHMGACSVSYRKVELISDLNMQMLLLSLEYLKIFLEMNKCTVSFGL